MRKAIWLCCALFWACSGGAGRAVVEGDGGLTGARVGRGAGGDARGAEVRSMLAPDLALAVDASAKEVLLADSAVSVDASAKEVLLADSAVSVDGQPWGRIDDAGVLHCSNGYYQAVSTGSRGDASSADCDYSRYVDTPVRLGVRCRRDLTGTLPVSCRWDSSDRSWTWYVRSCGDCVGLEPWDRNDGGAL